ncbi:MAG: hypothetical protein LIP23_03070, partial [Planctomycetes bacterium]|nr:hypothetical protein [Planctomycetota bacterium]
TLDPLASPPSPAAVVIGLFAARAGVAQDRVADRVSRAERNRRTHGGIRQVPPVPIGSDR